jgi:hypothetical protein
LNNKKCKNWSEFDLFVFFLLYEENKFIFNIYTNFDPTIYLQLNPDLSKIIQSKEKNPTNKELILHFINFGRFENRNIYELPIDFNWNNYVIYNKLKINNKYDAEYHFLLFNLEYKDEFISIENIKESLDISDILLVDNKKTVKKIPIQNISSNKIEKK